MIPTTAGHPGLPLATPRTRGDDPDREAFAYAMRRYSPHTRG